jgi:antitoxin FitA
MITLTIKGVSPDLYLRLKRRAKDQRRSLNREVILCLERAVGSEPFDMEKWLEEAARIRARVKGPPLTDARINAMKRWGR